jgi:hypothetical protein
LGGEGGWCELHALLPESALTVHLQVRGTPAERGLELCCFCASDRFLLTAPK